MTLIVIICLTILIGILTAPFVIKGVLNNALQKMDGYTVRTDRIRVNVFRSKIILSNVQIINNVNLKHNESFLAVPSVIISFKWRQLLRRIIDMNIVLEKPQLLYIEENNSLCDDENSNDAQQLFSLKKTIEKLRPFRISVDVRNGQTRYINPNTNPALDLAATELNFIIHNLSNRSFISNSCRIIGRCSLYEGNAAINVTLLPLEPTLTADIDLELTSINLDLLNDLLWNYIEVDINKGTMNLYSEIAVAGNSFKGYIKPLLKDLEFKRASGDRLLHKIKHRIVTGLYHLFKNKRNNQVATKIPIEGRLDDPNVSVGVAILGVLRNAFVNALTPSLDNVINLRSIWNRPRFEKVDMVNRFLKEERS